MLEQHTKIVESFSVVFDKKEKLNVSDPTIKINVWDYPMQHQFWAMCQCFVAFSAVLFGSPHLYCGANTFCYRHQKFRSLCCQWHTTHIPWQPTDTWVPVSMCVCVCVDEHMHAATANCPAYVVMPCNIFCCAHVCQHYMSKYIGDKRQPKRMATK